MSSDPPMNSTTSGTCSHIVAQVATSTRPPRQFAIEASITSILNTGISRSILHQKLRSYFTLSSTLQSRLDRAAARLPLAPAARHRGDVGVAHPLEVVRRE